MKWWLLGIAAGFALVAYLESRRKHRAYWHGPYLVQQLDAWNARTPYLDEPTIRPASLPAVQTLKATVSPKTERVRRFPTKASGSR